MSERIPQQSEGAESFETFGITTKNDELVTVRSIGENLWSIVDNSATKFGDGIVTATNLIFKNWDSEVQDLDNGNSDPASCWPGMSNKLRFGDVIIGTRTIEAESVEDIKEAFQKIEISAYCPGDI